MAWTGNPKPSFGPTYALNGNRLIPRNGLIFRARRLEATPWTKLCALETGSLVVSLVESRFEIKTRTEGRKDKGLNLGKKGTDWCSVVETERNRAAEKKGEILTEKQKTHKSNPD